MPRGSSSGTCGAGELAQGDDQREKDDLGKAWRQMMCWLIVDVPSRVELQSVIDHTASSAVVKLTARSAIRSSTRRTTLRSPSPCRRRMVAVADGSRGAVTGRAGSVCSRGGEPTGGGVAGHGGGDGERRPSAGEGEHGLGSRSRGPGIPPRGPDRDALERIAKATKGEIVELSNLQAFTASLAGRNAPIEETTTTPLWHHPVWWLMIVVGLCSEWAFRRSRGLP